MTKASSLDLLREAYPTISVGLLAANMMSLESEVSLLERTPLELLHFDVMDGCFTPMMTVGPPFIASVKTKLLKDVHLMIEEPLEKLSGYVAAGADIITVHAESTRHIHRVLQQLGQMENANDPNRGLIRGLALNPGTSLDQLEPLLEDLELIMLLGINPGWGGQSLISSTFARLRRVKQMILEAGREIAVSVDGGVTRDNLGELASEEVDIIVTGSAVFSGAGPIKNIRAMLDMLKSTARTGHTA